MTEIPQVGYSQSVGLDGVNDIVAAFGAVNVVVIGGQALDSKTSDLMRAGSAD
jgi:hypothetical protein